MNTIFLEEWGTTAAAALRKPREFDRWCGLFVKVACGIELTDEEKKTRAYDVFSAMKIEQKIDKMKCKYEKKTTPQNVDNQENDLGKTKTKTTTITKTITNTKEREFRERLSPTLDEVKKLCETEKYTFDPVKFHAHYSSIGWTVNGQPVTEWQALAAKWEATQQQHNNNLKNNNNGRNNNNTGDANRDGFSGNYPAEQETIHLQMEGQP